MNFVPVVAYHLCLNLPAAFSQPGNGNLAHPCREVLSADGVTAATDGRGRGDLLTFNQACRRHCLTRLLAMLSSIPLKSWVLPAQAMDITQPFGCKFRASCTMSKNIHPLAAHVSQNAIIYLGTKKLNEDEVQFQFAPLSSTGWLNRI